MSVAQSTCGEVKVAGRVRSMYVFEHVVYSYVACFSWVQCSLFASCLSDESCINKQIHVVTDCALLYPLWRDVHIFKAGIITETTCLPI